VHAHTGVAAHRIGPRDARMVARDRVVVPSQAGSRVEREHGSG
jgi:hypothetical protein